MASAASRWLGMVLAALGLAATFAPAAAAQGGQSTPGANVTAANPGTSPSGGAFFLAVTAHSANGSTAAPSCRPQDQTLRCFGSFVLRIAVPGVGNVTLTGLEVHRVAVGDTSCGGCEGDEATEAATAPALARDESDEAAVNGLSTVARGAPGLPTGSTVQVKMQLVEDGAAPYSGEADITISRFEEGSSKPPVYDTGVQHVLHVGIHLGSGASGPNA